MCEVWILPTPHIGIKAKESHLLQPLVIFHYFIVATPQHTLTIPLKRDYFQQTIT